MSKSALQRVTLFLSFCDALQFQEVVVDASFSLDSIRAWQSKRLLLHRPKMDSGYFAFWRKSKGKITPFPIPLPPQLDLLAYLYDDEVFDEEELLVLDEKKDPFDGPARMVIGQGYLAIRAPLIEKHKRLGVVHSETFVSLLRKNERWEEVPFPYNPDCVKNSHLG